MRLSPKSWLVDEIFLHFEANSESFTTVLGRSPETNTTKLNNTVSLAVEWRTDWQSVPARAICRDASRSLIVLSRNRGGVPESMGPDAESRLWVSRKRRRVLGEARHCEILSHPKLGFSPVFSRSSCRFKIQAIILEHIGRSRNPLNRYKDEITYLAVHLNTGWLQVDISIPYFHVRQKMLWGQNRWVASTRSTGARSGPTCQVLIFISFSIIL